MRISRKSRLPDDKTKRAWCTKLANKSLAICNAAGVQLQRKLADSTWEGYLGTLRFSGPGTALALSDIRGTRIMIQLTRLNNQPLVVNCDLIKFLEKSPDTVLTLVTGEKVVVRETPEQVLQKIIAFRQAVLLGLTLQSAGVAASTGAVAPSLEAEKHR